MRNKTDSNETAWCIKEVKNFKINANSKAAQI